MHEQETYERQPSRQPIDPGGAAAGDLSAQMPNEPYYQRRASPRRRGAAGAVLILVGLIWLGFAYRGQPPGAAGGTALVDQTLAGSRLEVSVGSSDVAIRTWDGSGIRVQAIQRGGSPGDYTVDVSASGGTVRVTEADSGGFCFFCSRELSYEISVPGSAQASVSTSSGDITIQGVGGPLNLSSTSGDLDLRDIGGDITLETASGHVRLADVGGKLDVTAISGDVELSDGRVSGASVQTTSGGIELEGVADDLELTSISGSISVRDARDARLAASTTSGDISFSGGLARDGSNTVSTISGQVSMDLSEDVGFRLSASTVSGEISTDFDLRDGEQGRRSRSGSVGDGSASLKIETTSGDIALDR